jgi:hypothetical protein
MRRTRGRSRTAFVAVLVLGVVGSAAAYWSAAGGTGSGAATTAAGAQSVSLTPATPSAELYPGGQAAVRLTIANPNAGAVRIGSLVLDTDQGSGGFAVDGAHSGCAVSTLTFTTQTNGGVGWNVPGGDSLAVTLPNALAMGPDAAQACQGATFTVYLEAGP